MPGYLRFVPPGQRSLVLMLWRMRGRGEDFNDSTELAECPELSRTGTIDAGITYPNFFQPIAQRRLSGLKPGGSAGQSTF